jgi:hypothetical protein
LVRRSQAFCVSLAAHRHRIVVLAGNVAVLDVVNSWF